MYGTGQYAAIGYGNFFGARQQQLAVTDAVDAAEALTVVGVFTTNVTDAIEATEVVTRIAGLATSVVDAIETSEVVTTVAAFLRTVTDSVAVADRFYGDWWMHLVKASTSFTNLAKSAATTFTNLAKSAISQRIDE